VTTTKIAIAVAATAALVAGLTGCASDSGTSTPTTLTVLAWKGSGNEVADLPQLNAAFAAKTGIKIDFKWVPRGDYETYNNPRLAAGDAADVMMLDKVLMSKWASQGYLADLSAEPWVSTMDPSLKPFNTIKGKTYQFNQENIGIGLYANMDLLKQAGIDPVPTDWPQFLSALKVLKEKNINRLMAGNKAGWSGVQIALALASNLVQSRNPSWAPDYDAGKVKFNPDWRVVVERMSEMLSDGLVDGKLMQGVDPWSDGNDQFRAGKWAFMVQGAWMLSDFTKNAKFPFTLSAFPGGAAGSKPAALTFVGTGLGMYAKAKNSDAARKYLAFMADPANATVYTKAEAAFSTHTGVISPMPERAGSLSEAFTAGRTAVSVAETLNFTGAEPAMLTAFQIVFENPRVDPAEVLSGLDKAIAPTKP